MTEPCGCPIAIGAGGAIADIGTFPPDLRCSKDIHAGRNTIQPRGPFAFAFPGFQNSAVSRPVAFSFARKIHRILSSLNMPQPLFHRRLDLPENPLKRGFVLPRATVHNHYQVLRAAEILNRKTVDRLREVGLKADTVALFYKRPGSMGIIHADIALIDGKWRRNIGAINWNLSGADSLMRWYAVQGKGVEPDPCPAEKMEPWYRVLNGIHFGYFGARDRRNLPKRKVRVLESTFVGSATLVRTDIPHAVENTDRATGRWALSVRCAPDFRSWREALAAVQPLLASPFDTSRRGKGQRPGAP